MNKRVLLLEYLASITDDGDSITNLGNGEIQVYLEGNCLTNYVFDKNSSKLKESVERLKNLYLEEEKKHWEECGKPNEHIYHDLVNIIEALE